MSNLARRLINNPGLIALTVLEEQEEIMVVPKFRKIKFAHFQKIPFSNEQIPFWHVMDPAHKSYKSTLSMEGLKQWGVL